MKSVLFLAIVMCFVSYSCAQSYYWERTVLNDEPLTSNTTRAHIFSTSAQEIKATVSCSENCDMYLMILAEYNKMKIGENFVFLDKIGGSRLGNFVHNNSYTISKILCVVAFNPTAGLIRLSYDMQQFIPVRQHRVWKQTMHALLLPEKQSDMRQFNMLANEAKARVMCNFVCQAMTMTFPEYQKFTSGKEYKPLESFNGLLMSFSILDEHLLAGKVVLVVSNRFQSNTIRGTITLNEHVPGEFNDPTLLIVFFILISICLVACCGANILVIILCITAGGKRLLHLALKRKVADDNDRVYLL
jgi:hypothetical protein